LLSYDSGNRQSNHRNLIGVAPSGVDFYLYFKRFNTDYCDRRGCVRTAARNAAMHKAHRTHEEEHGAAKRQMSRGCNYWHVKTAMPPIRKFL
jgi:hypothetical protein